MPLVSIIMLCYNHETFVAYAIESVLNQGFDDWELIIIDDASCDRSPLIIRDFAAKDRRIRTELHKENLGIARSVNQGIQMACGKYIAFLDSDDLWKVDKLEKQLKILDADDDLVVWSEGEIIDGHGHPTGTKFTEYFGPKIKKKSGNILDTLLLDNYIFQSSFIIKAENIKEIHFNEDLKYLNDYQFVIDLAKKYNFYFFDVPLASYRIHSGGTMFRDREDWIADEIKIRTYIMQNFAGQINADILKHNYSCTLDLFNERTCEILSQLREAQKHSSEQSSQLHELQKYSSEQSSQLHELQKYSSELSSQLQELQKYSSELSSQLQETQVRSRSLEARIAEMEESAIWQMLMKYHFGFVERALPQGTLRRRGYDIGIKGCRALIREGPEAIPCYLKKSLLNR